MRPAVSTSTAYSNTFARVGTAGGYPSGPGPRVPGMRLRALTEAECYARCYGGRSDERVTVVRVPKPRAHRPDAGERLRELFEERLDARPPDAEAA